MRLLPALELEPEDGQAVTPYRAGQYLSIYIRDEKSCKSKKFVNIPLNAIGKQ